MRSRTGNKSMGARGLTSLKTAMDVKRALDADGIGGDDLGIADDVAYLSDEPIPTGYYDLDYSIMTIGGLPMGRLVEISGPESGGKSLIAIRTMAQAQKRGYPCLLIDTEASYGDDLGLNWLRLNGVDTKELLYLHTVRAEEALRVALKAMEKGAKMVVIDSIAQLVTQEQAVDNMPRSGTQFAKAYEARTVASLARVLSDKLPELKSTAFKNGALIVCVNQLRDKPGMVYGDTESTKGGRALRHNADVRLRVARGNWIKDGDKTIGNEAMVLLKKSKVSPVNKKTGRDTPGNLAIYYDGRDPDQLDALIPVAQKLGFITKPNERGSILVYTALDGTQVKKNGRQALKDALVDLQLDAEMERRVKAEAVGQFEAPALIGDDDVAVYDPSEDDND